MTDSYRWKDYVYARNTEESADLFRASTLEQSTVLICGAGFDPRSADTADLLASLPVQNLTVIAIRPEVDGQHPNATSEAVTNMSTLQTLFPADITVLDPMKSSDLTTQAALLTRRLVEQHDLLNFSTIIVDLSGLPSPTSFAIIHLILQQSCLPTGTSNAFVGNLLVTVSDDPEIDENIRATGLEAPTVMNSFGRLPSDDATAIWVPVLGPGSQEEVKSLADFLGADEICPVLPFPAANERTGDNLILEHREVVGGFDFDYRNFLYASESNPFDLYRQLMRLATRYRAALAPLGEPSMIVSEHTSKLLSLGVLLAAHEAQYVVAHVRPTSYSFDGNVRPDREPRIHTAWLTGAPYA